MNISYSVFWEFSTEFGNWLDDTYNDAFDVSDFWALRDLDCALCGAPV